MATLKGTLIATVDGAMNFFMSKNHPSANQSASRKNVTHNSVADYENILSIAIQSTFLVDKIELNI